MLQRYFGHAAQQEIALPNRGLPAMFEKTLDTGNGEIKVSTRFVGAEEQVLLTLSGKSGTYIVDSSALLSDTVVSDLIDALQDALAKRRSVKSVETK
jgi:hypothetical protein